MNEKEIKDLALEVAEKMYSHYGDLQALDMMAEEFEGVLKLISERYCLVEKSEAKKLARLTFENGGSDDYGLIDGLVDWVEENFNEEYCNECENGIERR